MPSVPFPLTGLTMDDFRSQVYELLRYIYEETIGGANLGDVFSIVGDVLTLAIDESTPGLTKSGNKLAVLLNPDGGLLKNSLGLYINCTADEGLEVDAGGLGVKLDGATLSMSALGLKVNTALIDIGALVANNIVKADAAGTGIETLAPNAGWSTTNVTPDKTLDADAAGLAEVADVLGTLIETLITQKVISA